MMLAGNALAAVAAHRLAGVALDVGDDLASGVPRSPADVLVAFLAALAAAGLAWLVLGVACEALSYAPGTLGRAAARVSAAVSPRMVRRAAGVLLGIGLGAGTTGGAALAAPARTVTAVVQENAADVAPPGTGARGLPDPAWKPAPDPGWVPAAPRARPQPDVSVVATAGRRQGWPEPHEVVVHRGDSLWSIAARGLGPDATDAEVAEAWPHWYAANRDVIGPDPDLILPGQVLRAPAVEDAR
jgi:nucleoid-associated protein YgaU